MDIFKLLIVFLIIMAVLWMKRPISIAVIAAGIASIALYGLSPTVSLNAIVKGAFAWSTIETLLVFYSITFLQRMMEKRGDLGNVHKALSGLFNNNRINASVAPFFLGMLPAAGTVLICGPIVRESTGDSLETDETAAVTSYFRHVSESFLPTYTTIFIAITLANGRVSAPAFILAMLPMVAALFMVGWIVYLRRIPKETGVVPDQPKSYYWKLLFRSVWMIVLTIALILILELPVELAVLVSIIINIFVNHFSVRELIPFIRSAFETRLILNTWLIMIFKEILTATGVIQSLPAAFSALPVPTFVIFALIFFLGTIVAGSQAMIVLCMSMAMETVAPGHSGLALFVLLMCMNYIAMQLSPTHICLTICAEDFGISLGALIRRTVPLVLTFTVLAFAYYGVLFMIGA